MKKYDFLIVGSGLFGATFSRLATDAGKKCLVIDRRNNLGGNLFCEKICDINVHVYGAHIFHTSNKDIWDFVNNTVPFNRYTNSPVAVAPDGNLYNLPFNMNTFHSLWGVKNPSEAMDVINAQRAEAIRQYGGGQDGYVPRNLEEQAILLVGKDIFNLLIKEYTEKQWGRPCEELPASIIRRLPVRLTFDNNYFNDTYQGIPIGGYNPLIEKLLLGADIKVGCDFFDNKDGLIEAADKVIYTGPIDRFYDFCFGALNYRTVRFDNEVLDMPNYQGNAVVNYTTKEIPYTRVIEHKHFEMFGDKVYDNNKTVISREYSTEWADGMEPFYPVNDQENQMRFGKYKQLAEKERDVLFGGRLADYAYYDMAPTIEKAMDLFRKAMMR